MTPAERGDWLQTYTGRAFYPMAPAAEDVDPIDIAHALSLLCRYGGHVRSFYSVAEHCVLMSHAVAPAHALWALLHDATEAYMGDLIRPLKLAMPAYRDAEHRLMDVICRRFGLDPGCPAEVKLADNRILRDERDALMGPAPLPWNSLEQVPALGVRIEGWSPADAEQRYLDRLVELLVHHQPTCCDAPMVHNSGNGLWECSDAFFALLDDEVIDDAGDELRMYGPLTEYHDERYRHWTRARVPDAWTVQAARRG